METKLLQLQNKIFQYHNSLDDPYVLESPRVYFMRTGGFYDISFYGSGHDDDPNIKSSDLPKEDYNFGFCSLIDLICDYPDKIISLNFNGPDEGANGTKVWDFTRLINSGQIFKNIKYFKVQLTNVGDHNQSVIGGFEENGMIAKLVKLMPNLEELIVPSAPDSSFFEIKKLKIRSLVVQAGYDHQKFIRNLSKSSNFEQLKALDFTERFNQFNDLIESDFTSEEDFINLFKSKLFSNNNFHFKLRSINLSNDFLKKLLNISKIQFLYIETKCGQYISHLK